MNPPNMSPNKSRKDERKRTGGFTTLQIDPTKYSDGGMTSSRSTEPVGVTGNKSENIELRSKDLQSTASCSKVYGETHEGNSDVAKITTDVKGIRLEQQSKPKTLKKVSKEKVLDAQEKFRLRVPRASTKSEYISRMCRYHQISEPRRNMPLAVINFDSLNLKLTQEDVLLTNKKTIYNLLEDIYPYFNIGVWSSLKMTDFLQLLKKHSLFNADRFEIAFCLDSSSMINAFVPGLGNSQVKAMEIVWNLFPNYHKDNSVMIDELLKKLVFKNYNIPMDAKADKRIQESEYGVVAEFLIYFFRSGQHFSKLNIPTWKLSWNQQL